MALVEKLEADVELKCSADKFFEIWSYQASQAPDAASDKVHAVEVHEGDWIAAGSVKLWTYTIGMAQQLFYFLLN